MEEYVDRFYEAAATGDQDTVKYILKGLPNVDIKNKHGWTALMFAARNGHSEVIKVLLEHGADKSIINSSGQNAEDIAKFWGHKSVESVLAGRDTSVFSAGIPNKEMVTNFFSHNPLDRAAHHRKDKAWLEQAMADKTTKFLLFSDLQPLTMAIPDVAKVERTPQYRAFTVDCDDIKSFLETKPTIVFLGIEKNIRTEKEHAWFAVDATELADDTVKAIHPRAEYIPPFPLMMMIEERDAAICGQARTLLAWHDRYQFCPTCGGKTQVEEAGYKRACANVECRSQKGVHNTSYPRLDPTVIMAVISPDGKEVLLGRQKNFPKGMYSCLAGFVEAGESIEDACRRETLEESGVKVGRVDYHSCQPWPMPASLMIGCIGHATTTSIQIDQDELEDARWFSRHDAIQMLNRKHANHFFCPPQEAIAHNLIKAFVNLTANL